MNAPPQDRPAARRTDPHEQYEQLVVGYALHALEPDEEQLLLRHLPSCAACGRALIAHRDTLGHLAHVVAPVELPIMLWDGIRREIEAVSPEAFSRQVDLRETAAAPSVPAARDELADMRSRGLRRASLLTAAAAVVALVVGLGTWNVVLQRDRTQQHELSAGLREAVDALGESPARTVPLKDTADRVAAVAVVSADRISLLVDGLQPNDTSNSTYVLWGKSGVDPPQALAAFDVRDGDLDVLRDVPLPPAARPVPDVLLITHEPGRSAPARTEQPALVSGRA